MTMSFSLSQLRSERSSRRLETIANLRSCGLGDHIDLPQLVVCGDQSSGKSSVLSGITGIPFPRQDGLCTRFATEITLTHIDRPYGVEVQIIPGQLRSNDDRNRLTAYNRTMKDFSELPTVITEVGELMGLRSDLRPDGLGFAQDVLRIRVEGPVGMHLTVVDLPGLIASPDEDQVDGDVQVVNDLVDRYVSNPRTIILAVVQAPNDINNQGIFRKVKKFDQTGQRTVGVITKPDMINKGTEPNIAKLARNEGNIKLKLGFFIVKNPAPEDMDSMAELKLRDDGDAYFLGAPWSAQNLNMERVGIVKLRGFLQHLLDQHIERELPSVREEANALLKKLGKQIHELGHERSTPAESLLFLVKLSMSFQNITRAALQGDYEMAEDSFFAIQDSEREFARLRAFVHELNTRFSNDMRVHGAALKIVDESDVSDDADVNPWIIADSVEHLDSYETLNNNQKLVSEKQMKAMVMKVYRRTKGRELPGNYNHVLQTSLFHLQSSRWSSYAQVHLTKVCKGLTDFMREAIKHVSAEELVCQQLLTRIEIILDRNKAAAEAELEQICLDQAGPPITYNHYYTDNVQNGRHSNGKNLIRKALKNSSFEEYNGKMHVSNTTVDAEKLLSSLQKHVLVDMDEQAISEARAGLDAYYKVARKTFVDNVCIQVIERHLLRDLAAVFSPEIVAALSEEELQAIGGEQQFTLNRRKELHSLHERLKHCLDDLRKV